MAQLSITFFLQMALILVTCRVVGWLGRKYLKQPQVVSEMIAGVLLGPSLFGLLAPDLQRFVFRPENQGVLYVGAQFGVGLYMFLVGLGFRTDDFRANVHRAAIGFARRHGRALCRAVAATPWLMTCAGAVRGHGHSLRRHAVHGRGDRPHRLPDAGAHHPRARPQRYLARHAVAGRGRDRRRGRLVRARRRARDLRRSGAGVAYTAIVGGIVFAAFMIFVMPRLLAPLARRAERDAAAGKPLNITTARHRRWRCSCCRAFTADAIGMHAVFGGFLLGCAMPRGALAEQHAQAARAVHGRRAAADVLHLLGSQHAAHAGRGPELLMIALVVLGRLDASPSSAPAGRPRGCSGEDNRTALGIGALMNSRGLMELIIINIGLQAGVIGPALFSMLVLMAIVTTLMASPLFEVVYGRNARESGELGALESAG